MFLWLACFWNGRCLFDGVFYRINATFQRHQAQCEERNFGRCLWDFPILKREVQNPGDPARTGPGSMWFLEFCNGVGLTHYLSAPLRSKEGGSKWVLLIVAANSSGLLGWWLTAYSCTIYPQAFCCKFRVYSFASESLMISWYNSAPCEWFEIFTIMFILHVWDSSRIITTTRSILYVVEVKILLGNHSQGTPFLFLF